MESKISEANSHEDKFSSLDCIFLSWLFHIKLIKWFFVYLCDLVTLWQENLASKTRKHKVSQSNYYYFPIEGNLKSSFFNPV